MPESSSSMHEKFKANLPDTLYMSHYDLSNAFIGFSAEEWRQYLRDNDKFITREVAAITESEARKALSRLSTGKLTAQEVSAIKQILDRSEQINKQNQDSRTFVTTFMPNIHAPKPEPIDQDLLNRQIFADNRAKVRAIYYPDEFDTLGHKLFYERVQRGEIIQNADGTITIVKPDPRSQRDRLYLETQIQI